MESIDWSSVRLVIFDVDGTLYDQACMRRRMLWELGRHSVRHPTDLSSLKVIAEFRRCRELLAEEGADRIRELQYRRPAASLGIRPDRVAEVVGEWFEKRPLDHLRRCRFAAVDKVFECLRESDRSIAVFSDYPVRDKLRALDLDADFIVAGPDPEIDRLKPHPAGLHYLMSCSGVPPQQCVMIGDREDRDGACARRAGIPYLIKTSTPRAPHHFRDFEELLPALVGVE